MGANPGVMEINLDSKRFILKTRRPRVIKAHPGVAHIGAAEAQLRRCGDLPQRCGTFPVVMEFTPKSSKTNNLESKRLILKACRLSLEL
jgi:hypothetical protein